MLGFVGWPTPTLIQGIEKFMATDYNLDATKKGLIGVWMKSISTPNFIFIVESFLLIAVIGAIGTVCAWKIHLCIRRNSMSSTTRKMHRQMLTMLLVQD
ncbi:hypothetical protein COOONC_17439 [Cooperia oncophora]